MNHRHNARLYRHDDRLPGFFPHEDSAPQWCCDGRDRGHLIHVPRYPGISLSVLCRIHSAHFTVKAGTTGSVCLTPGDSGGAMQVMEQLLPDPDFTTSQPIKAPGPVVRDNFVKPGSALIRHVSDFGMPCPSQGVTGRRSEMPEDLFGFLHPRAWMGTGQCDDLSETLRGMSSGLAGNGMGKWWSRGESNP